MNRRTFVRNALLGGTAAFAPTIALAARGVSARNAIRSLHLTVLLLLATNQVEAAGRAIMKLQEYSRVDPYWFTYTESFELLIILFKITPKSDEDRWLYAAKGLLDCFPGFSGHVSENLYLVSKAGNAILQAGMSGRLRLSRTELSRTACLLLLVLGAAPGAERPTWARAARSAIKIYGDQPLKEWATDRVSPRFVAAGIAVSGDWKTAANEYDKLLTGSIGTMSSSLNHKNRGTIRGLAGLFAGETSLESEAATVFAMAGQANKAVIALEHSRRNTISKRKTATQPVSPDAALSQEDILLSQGTVIVQIATNFVGSFAMLSRKVGPKILRSISFDHTHGGTEFPGRMGNSGALHFSKDGLMNDYQKARRKRGAKQKEKLKEYVARAINISSDFIGKVVGDVLEKAKIPRDADVLIVAPPGLAILPVSLARSAPISLPLSRKYKLRFSDSLTSAVSALNTSIRYRNASPELSLVGSNSSLAPTFAGVESAFIEAFFAQKEAETYPADNGSASPSKMPSRGGYWHIANHAAWNFKNPEKSGILLRKNTNISIDDVLDLVPERPPRLVFLSACETAMVNIKKDLDRFVSFPAAFLAAGAGGIIASHWPVSDAASALLAIRFYEEHIINGQQPNDALSEAKLWLSSTTAGSMMDYLVTKSGRDPKLLYATGDILALLSASNPGSKPFSQEYYWGGFQLFGT